MVETKSGYIEVNGGKLYYEMAGTGEALILGHAGIVDSRMWDSQWAAFAAEYRVVRFDLHGYGKSSPVDGPVNRREDVLGLLDGLDIQQAHLLGCSMSGENFIDFTIEHPERVKSLTAIAATPSGFELQGEMPPNMMEMIEAAQAGDFENASEYQIRVSIDGMFRKPEQVNAQVREQVLAMNRVVMQSGVYFKANAQPFEPLNPPAAERLSEIKQPVLVIDGGLDHPEILRAGDIMVEAIADARKVVIPEAAHLPNMEQPDLFNRAVLDFLKSI